MIGSVEGNTEPTPYERGRADFFSANHANPFPADTPHHTEWERGHYEAMEDAAY